MTKPKSAHSSRFISARERRERVLLLMPAKGFASVNQLAEAMGVTWTSLDKSLRSDSLTANTICKLAETLGVTVNFLLER